MKESIIKNFPKVDPLKIELIHWGVDKRFYTNKKDEALLEQLKLGRNKKVFFCIRSMSSSYHKHEILKAFLSYKEKFKNSDLLLISSMQSYNNSNHYFDELCNIIERSKFKEDIVIVDIAHKEMHKYLSVCDAVVSFSKTDGLSQSLMEATASKKFCFTYDNNNHKDIITHKDNGYYFKDMHGLEKAFSYKFDKKLKGYNVSLNKEEQTKKYLNICRKIISQG